MLSELIGALLAAALVALIPGWFWTKLLLPHSSPSSRDLYVQLSYSLALSMALVPAVALLPTRLLGMGVSLSVTLGCVGVVFFGGVGAYLFFGGEKKGLEEPLAPSAAAPLGVLSLMLVALAFGLALGVAFGVVPSVPVRPPITVGVVPNMGVLLAIALLVFFAGLVHLLESGQVQPQERPFAPRRPSVVLAQRLLLPVVLLLALLRGYLGPVLHDWPFIRGVDHYSHAVMTELMMTKGRIEPYLIYPPGFHTLTAMVCRLTGLEPLELFPLLAPLLLLLPALALYALARRLWGWHYGVAAALFSVLLGGTYLHFAEARYPNFVASQFLMVVGVGALVSFYASPTIRGGLLLAILGSSVVLYHQIASYSLAVLLAVVGVVLVPYLLIRDRKKAVALVGSLGLLGLLSVLYAWDTYDLPQAVAGMLGGSGSSTTGTAVTMAIGTQDPYPLNLLAGDMVSQAVAWLGLLGVLLVAGELVRRRLEVPQTLAYLTLLLWTVLLFVGSRTPLSGFPDRFERDLGIPLAVFAAFAFVAILRSLPGSRSKQVPAVFVASLTVLLASTLVGVRVVSSLESASDPSVQMTMTPEIAAAGEWLREHNEGGNIMVSPHVNQVPSRMMLAMGHYSALQSFEVWQIERPRDLPPTGAQPLKDVFWVMRHPQGGRTDEILKKYDVRYIVLYKNMPDRPTIDYWKGFEARPELYRTVFENEDVLIVTRRETASAD